MNVKIIRVDGKEEQQGEMKQMTTARQINAVIDDARKQGRNVYGYNLVINSIGLISDRGLAIRVIRAKTKNGDVCCRKTDGTWVRTAPSSTFDVR